MNRPIMLAFLFAILTGSAFSQSRVSIGFNGGVQTALSAFDGGRCGGMGQLRGSSARCRFSAA